MKESAGQGKGKPRVAVTMGDPAGVGPEVCLRALADPALKALCEMTLIGDPEVLRRVAERCRLPLPAPRAVDAAGSLDAERLQPGQASADCGRAAYAYIERAIELAQNGAVDAVATGPINKTALHLAGIAFPGHTEIFAAKTGSTRFCMMQTSAALTIGFATTHLSLHAVSNALSQARVFDVMALSLEAAACIHGPVRRMVVCGLNPHAGEEGLFGREERDHIVPAIQAAIGKGWPVVGPVPPDTAFLPAERSRTDVYVCMYHDQGHIPLKMLAFDEAVNITLGLPIIRTSVDHGTAFDIAWQGRAIPGSLCQAIRLAARLAAR